MKKIRIIIVLLILYIFPLPQNSSAQIAVSAGTGCTFASGEINDPIDYMIPFILSGQYAALPQLSLELEACYDVYTNEKNNYDEYSQYQIGAGIRYWTSQTSYKGLHLGLGIAMTSTEAEFTNSYFNPPTSQIISEQLSESDIYKTLIVKIGFVFSIMDIDSMNLNIDVGLKNDLIDFKDSQISPYIACLLRI